jgi:uncharacterized protein YkwD
MQTKKWLLLFFFILPFGLMAQSFPGWTAEVLLQCNTAKDNKFMSDQEKQVLLLMNMARNNGKLFASGILKNYLDTVSRTYSKDYVSSLKADLKSAMGLSALVPDADLFNEAVVHAADMGRSGKTGHNTSTGKKPDDRFRKLNKDFSTLAENCHYGTDDPLTIVVELLIDDKIAGVGHRKNMLNKTLMQAGVAIKPHTKYGFNTVMDFGTRVKN